MGQTYSTLLNRPSLFSLPSPTLSSILYSLYHSISSRPMAWPAIVIILAATLPNTPVEIMAKNKSFPRVLAPTPGYYSWRSLSFLFLAYITIGALGLVTPLSFAHITHLIFRFILRYLSSHVGVDVSTYLAHHSILHIISSSYALIARMVMSLATSIPIIANIAEYIQHAFYQWDGHPTNLPHTSITTTPSRFTSILYSCIRIFLTIWSIIEIIYFFYHQYARKIVAPIQTPPPIDMEHIRENMMRCLKATVFLPHRHEPSCYSTRPHAHIDPSTGRTLNSEGDDITPKPNFMKALSRHQEYKHYFQQEAQHHAQSSTEHHVEIKLEQGDLQQLSALLDDDIDLDIQHALKHVNSTSRMAHPPHGLQRDTSEVRPYRIMAESGDPREFLRGWFFGVPLDQIKRGNVEEWIASSTFNKHIWDLTIQEREQLQEIFKVLKYGVNTILRKRLEMQLHKVQSSHGFNKLASLPSTNQLEYDLKCAMSYEWDYEPGYNPKLRMMKVGLDPVIINHRPFLYYAATIGFDLVCRMILTTQYGYHRYRAPCVCTDTPCTCKPIHYFYRPPNLPANAKNQKHLRTRPPIVFCHGIGVGVGSYLSFIIHLHRTHGEAAPYITHDSSGEFDYYLERGVFLLECPHISMSLNLIVPTSKQIVASITQAVKDHAPTHSPHLCTSGVSTTSYIHHQPEWAKELIPPEKDIGCCFVGHSYGSIVTSWCIRQRPTLVSRILLIDPVCFLLFESVLPYSFLYRPPESPGDLFLDHYVSKDIGIAHTLSRHFWWYENVLWAEDLTYLNPTPETSAPSLSSSIISSPLKKPELHTPIISTSNNTTSLSPATNGLVPNIHVFFSGHDRVVCAPTLRRYLEVKRSQGILSCDIIFQHGFGHAQFLFSSRVKSMLLTRI